MKSKTYLEGADQLTKEECEELMDKLGVTKMDIADACGFTYSTLQTYWYDRIPDIHHQTIINLFIDKLSGGSSNGKKTSPKQKQDRRPEDPAPQEAESKAANKEIPTGESPKDTPQGLQHLVPDRIIFRPKGGVAEAMQEAAEIADEERSEVVLRVGKRLITINVEEVD